MDEKGYIQYDIDWLRKAPPTYQDVTDLIEWRRRLFEANLIGVDNNGIGFGNISARDSSGNFWISGTQTGALEHLGPEHFALVTAFDIAGNKLTCEGPVKASSEALSHAILYDLDPTIGGVVHVHAPQTWTRLFGELPTTDRVAEAGTVQMAEEIGNLYDCSDLRRTQVLVMGGHRDGLMSFGESVEDAASKMIEICTNF